MHEECRKNPREETLITTKGKRNFILLGFAREEPSLVRKDFAREVDVGCVTVSRWEKAKPFEYNTAPRKVFSYARAIKPDGEVSRGA